jgi:hypothetical protein
LAPRCGVFQRWMNFSSWTFDDKDDVAPARPAEVHLD